MRTIARNATKKIEAIKAEFTDCEVYDRDKGEMRPSDAAYAWKALGAFHRARLVESTAGDRYTVQVSSSLWYHLTRPTA
jgi:hypothetical protein